MLTVNIEDNSLKITLIKGKHVAFAAEGPLEPGWVQNGVVMEKAGVAQVISTMLGQNNLKEKDCVACVSGMQSIYRMAYVPKLNPALLAEAANREMERAIPVPLNSLYTFWTHIRISSVETALCLVGLPFDNVNSVMETLQLGGLKPRYLELKPLAVSRVIDEKSAIVLDVQQSGFDITIVNDGLAELIRSLPFPSLTMSDADRAALVKEEVDKTIKFYNSGHPGNPLDDQAHCILSGNLREQLSGMLGYRSKPAPGLLFYPDGQDANTFVANTGMALRTINKLTRVDINVIPQAAPTAGKAAKGGPASNMVPLVALAVAAVVVLGTWYLSSTAAAETIKLQLQMNDRTKQLSEMQKQYREKTDRDTKELAAYQGLVDTFGKPIKYVSLAREAVSRNISQAIMPLPGNVYLAGIEVSPGKVVLQGSAPSEEILLNYARDLRSKGTFGLVMITSLDKSSFTEVSFSITLTAAN